MNNFHLVINVYSDKSLGTALDVVPFFDNQSVLKTWNLDPWGFLKAIQGSGRFPFLMDDTGMGGAGCVMVDVLHSDDSWNVSGALLTSNVIQTWCIPWIDVYAAAVNLADACREHYVSDDHDWLHIGTECGDLILGDYVDELRESCVALIEQLQGAS